VALTLHSVAEFADFSDVCTSAVFICGSCRCGWNLYGSECTDTVCIPLSTDTEILLLLETAACRSLAVVVVISRASADEARVRWQFRRAAGGALMTISAASLPLDAADR